MGLCANEEARKDAKQLIRRAGVASEGGGIRECQEGLKDNERNRPLAGLSPEISAPRIEFQQCGSRVQNGSLG